MLRSALRNTLAKVCQQFYWVHCREDVGKWCRKCATCAATQGPITRVKGTMKQDNVGVLFERIAIDVAGPFLTTTNNKYMDYICKWPEAYAITTQEASKQAQVLVDNLVCRFGVPLELHLDQGRNFESRVFLELCCLLDITKTSTTPLHRSGLSDSTER